MLKTKLGHVIPMNTPKEEAAIRKGMAADLENPEWTANMFTKAKPASEFFPPETYAKLVAMKRPRGRPKADTTKVFTAMRLDADVLEAFKSSGKGWQTRINAALRQFITEHPISR